MRKAAIVIVLLCAVGWLFFYESISRMPVPSDEPAFQNNAWLPWKRR
jgi:hypothetical protein